MSRKLPQGSRLVLASHNKGKFVEIEDLLRPWQIDVVSAAALGLPEPDETETTFIGNARLKALAAAATTNLPALSDDSGFCAAALNGAPGIYSARWAGPNKDFAAAMARVWSDSLANPDKTSWFIAALCLAWPDGHTETFEGRVNGTMVWPPRGTNGFGYDPMFLPEGGAETYGEMDQTLKHATSHRARAFAQLTAACFSQ
jgi:XTP/dITP diphosphohydrolase